VVFEAEKVVLVRVGLTSLTVIVMVEVSIVVEVRVVVGPVDKVPVLCKRANALIGDEFGVLLEVEGARFLLAPFLLASGTSHPFDAASRIPSYHARAISEYPWSVGCNPSSRSPTVT
jgi:hypothetical protein